MPQVYAMHTLHTNSLEYCYVALLILELMCATTAHVAVRSKVRTTKIFEMRQNHKIWSHVCVYEGSMQYALDKTHVHVSICSAHCYTFIGLDIIFSNRSQWIGHSQRTLILPNFQVSHYEIINCIYTIGSMCI